MCSGPVPQQPPRMLTSFSSPAVVGKGLCQTCIKIILVTMMQVYCWHAMQMRPPSVQGYHGPERLEFWQTSAHMIAWTPNLQNVKPIVSPKRKQLTKGPDFLGHLRTLLVVAAHGVGQTSIGVAEDVAVDAGSQVGDVRLHVRGAQGTVEAHRHGLSMPDAVPESLVRLTAQRAARHVHNRPRDEDRNSDFLDVNGDRIKIIHLRDM